MTTDGARPIRVLFVCTADDRRVVVAGGAVRAAGSAWRR
jgi:hypothetical protein